MKKKYSDEDLEILSNGVAKLKADVTKLSMGVNKLKADKQKLVDIVYQVGLTIKDSDVLKAKSNDELAEWISKQLSDCGFKTNPCGMSWGVLEDKS